MRIGGVSVGSSRSVSSASPYDSTDRHSQFDDKSLTDECQLNYAPIFPIRSKLHAQKDFRVQITRPHKIRPGKPVVRMGKARCPHGQSPLSAWVYLSAPLQNL